MVVMKSYKMTYSEVEKYCSVLADKLISVNPTLIVGITRGGLVPAVHLSHFLNIPMECITWQTRDGGVKQKNNSLKKTPNIQHDHTLLKKYENIVFVDDINDSGKTFTEIKDYYGNHNFACLIEKLDSTFKCNFAGDKTDTERWICFPWEYDSNE